MNLKENTNLASWEIPFNEVFKKWLAFTAPAHGLSDMQITVFAEFLKWRCIYSSDISNPEILDKFVLSLDVRRQVREALNIDTENLERFMVKFRKKGVITKDRINPLFIPNIQKDSKYFNIVLNFRLTHD